MLQKSMSPIITHLICGCYGQPVTTKDKQRWICEVLSLSSYKNGHNTSKYTSKIKFSDYHPLNMLLLGATSDN